MLNYNGFQLARSKEIKQKKLRYVAYLKLSTVPRILFLLHTYTYKLNITYYIDHEPKSFKNRIILSRILSGIPRTGCETGSKRRDVNLLLSLRLLHCQYRAFRF